MMASLWRTIAGWSAVRTVLVGTVACSTGAGACPVIVADVPAAAAPGATIAVRLSELWASCADGGQGAPQGMERVEVLAVVEGDPDKVLASASADVTDDATAVVELALPVDALGVVDPRVGDETVAQVTVARP